MTLERSTIVMLSMVCGTLAGGAIGFGAARGARAATVTAAPDAETVARLGEIASTLSAIAARLESSASAPASTAPASDPAKTLAPTIDGLREELKQHTIAIERLSQRPLASVAGAATIGAPEDLDASAIEKVNKALKMTGPAKAAMQRRFLLMTPQEVVAELGRPSMIAASRTDPGVTWMYDANGDGTPECQVQMHSGYVVRIDP